MKNIFLVFVIMCVMLLSCSCNVLSERYQSYDTMQRLGFDEYDMVVIAPAVFSAALQPFIDHKNGRDVLTFLKTTEDIYSEYGGRDAERVDGAYLESTVNPRHECDQVSLGRPGRGRVVSALIG